MEYFILILGLIILGFLWSVGCIYWSADERGQLIDHIPYATEEEYEEIVNFLDDVSLNKHVWLRATFRNPFDGWNL